MKRFSLTLISSLLCCVVFYTGMLKPCVQEPLYSLIQNHQINYIKGNVVSNPVKSSSGKTYSVVFAPVEVGILAEKSQENIYSSSSGEITLYIPCEIVEAYYPGKLFSLASGIESYKNKTQEKEKLFGSETQFPIIEEGVSLEVEASILEQENNSQCFYVKKILSQGYESKIKFYRAYSRLFLKRILFNWGECGGLLLALLSGSKEYTSVSVQDNFKNAGLAHVLALSGMHLSIFASLPSKIKKKKTELVSLILVILFVWFAGLSPSLFRALLCMILGLVFKKLEIKTDLLGILSISFLIQISIFPTHIYNYGFILSYGALVGLELGQQFVLPLFCKLFPKKLSTDLASSVGAQTITSPITLVCFGTCSPIGIIASVVVSPVANFFLSFGIFALVLSLFFPFLLEPIGCIMSMIYVILTWIVNFFSKFPIIQI